MADPRDYPRQDTRDTDGVTSVSIEVELDPDRTVLNGDDVLRVNSTVTDGGRRVAGAPCDGDIGPGQAVLWLVRRSVRGGDLTVRHFCGGTTASFEDELDVAATLPDRFTFLVVAKGVTESGRPWVRIEETDRLLRAMFAPDRADARLVSPTTAGTSQVVKMNVRHVEEGGGTGDPVEIPMQPVLRHPLNFLVPRERVATDRNDGSLFTGFVPDTQNPNHQVIVRVATDGTVSRIHPAGDLELDSVRAFSGFAGALWVALADRLVHVRALEDRTELNRELGVRVGGMLAMDPFTGSAWGFAPNEQGQMVLHRFGADEARDLTVQRVRPSGRSYLEATYDGGVVLSGLNGSTPEMMRVDLDGKVVAHGFPVPGLRPTEVAGLAANPSTGEVWMLAKVLGNTVLHQISPDFELVRRFGPNLGGIAFTTLWSVDVHPVTGEPWVAGHEMVPDPDGSGDLVPRTAVVRLDASGSWTPVAEGVFDPGGLIRTFW